MNLAWNIHNFFYYLGHWNSNLVIYFNQNRGLNYSLNLYWNFDWYYFLLYYFDLFPHLLDKCDNFIIVHFYRNFYFMLNNFFIYNLNNLGREYLILYRYKFFNLLFDNSLFSNIYILWNLNYFNFFLENRNLNNFFDFNNLGFFDYSVDNYFNYLWNLNDFLNNSRNNNDFLNNFLNFNYFGDLH